MDLDFLKPTKEKIWNAFLLLLLAPGIPLAYLALMIVYFNSGIPSPDNIFVFLTMFIYAVYAPFMLFFFLLGLFIVFPLSLFVFAIPAYFFGSRIAETKNWIANAAFHLVFVLIIIPIALVVLVFAYNQAFGYYCQADQDCSTKRCGSYGNKNYIYLSDPFLMASCAEGAVKQ